MSRLFFALLVFLTVPVFADERADFVLADFEGDSYAPWTVEGEAFGVAPALGTLPNQMEVSGFNGRGLANSFVGGDGKVGRLISPEYKIERRYLNFLIGGGGFEESVYMALFVEGKEVRRATGFNTRAGGSERLEPFFWDLSEFIGKEARIEIVDSATGGWGHINVDAITSSDTSCGKESKKIVYIEKSREIKSDKNFLLIPVAREGRTTILRVEVDGEWVREMRVGLPNSKDETLFYASLQITPWQGKSIRLIAEQVPENCKALDDITESDTMADIASSYKEKYRPQFHISPRRGWTNDPNGLLWYNGKYHLFYQHNPYGTDWGNMTWGHATSPDLFHWSEGPDAICPDKLGTIFSGSGVVDSKNSSGLAAEGASDPALIVFYTSHGPEARPPQPVTQSLAYSLDGGKTWTKYAKNPIVPNIISSNRDPKVFWHEPSQKWIMALYLDGEDYALLGSKNLTDWNQLSRIEKLGCSECPDMFELAVDGDANNKKWVFWGGDGNYLIGDFDGVTFTKETGPFRSKHGGNDYAAQTFFDLPDGRRIQFSWMNGGQYPDMPFNQQFSVPRELSLKTTDEGVRLAFSPAKELESLRGNPIAKISEKPDENGVLFKNVPELFDIETTVDVTNAKTVKIEFKGQTLEYKVADGKINGRIPLKPVEGKITLRLVVDRMSWELFAENGVTQYAECFVPSDEVLSAYQASKGKFSISAGENESVKVENLTIWPLCRVWD